MKKSLYLIIFMLAIIFSACINTEENELIHSVKGLTVTSNNLNTNLIAQENAEAFSININGLIYESDIIYDEDQYLLILNRDSNNTIISIVSKKESISKGDILFSIKNIKESLEGQITKTITTISNNSNISSVDKLLGDMNSDDKIDSDDLNLFFNAYLSDSSDSHYNVKADISPSKLGSSNWEGYYSQSLENGIIDLNDFLVFAKNFEKEKPIISITLESINIKGDSTVYIGESIKLNAEATYSDGSTSTDEINWESSNKNVATVSNGIINPINTGKTIITASINNVLDTIEITVKEEILTIEKIEITGITKIKEGNTANFTALVTYNNNTTSDEVEWSSSNTNIAKIDNNGKVTAISKGTAIIKATKDNVEKTLSISITKDIITVSSISITGDNNVNENQSIILTAIVKYSDDSTDNNVTWTSSNEDIATIDNNGKITAIKEGSVTITASNDKSKTFKVTVNKVNITINKIEIDGKNTVNEGSTITLNATVTYSDGSSNDDVTWTSSDEDVATVNNNGVLTGIKEGSTNIIASKDDFSSDKYSITVNSVGTGITIYIDAEFGDGLYAWVDKTKILGEWPGKKLTDSVEELGHKFWVYTFDKKYTSVSYLVIKGTDKVTEDDQTETDVEWWDKDGNNSDECPYAPKKPSISISDLGNTLKGNYKIQIQIITNGADITDIDGEFNGKSISFNNNTASLLVSDYINDKESGNISINVSSDLGNSKSTGTISRDDNPVQPEVDGPGVMLHAYRWTFNNIKNSLQEIKDSGYSSIQVSPVQGTKSNDASCSWYLMYQPVNLNIGNAQLGSYDDFKSLCQAANQIGIKIIVDAVLNQVADNGTDGGWDPNLDGSLKNSDYFHGNGTCTDYNSRKLSTQNNLGNGPDWNTQSSKVQEMHLAFLNSCVDAGAGGFRFDAAKHIETNIGDDAGKDWKGNYWNVILNGMHRKDELYIFGEVLYDGGSNIEAYKTLFDITAHGYGWNLRGAVHNKNLSEAIEIPQLTTDQSLAYVENHDNYEHDESKNTPDQEIILATAIMTARSKLVPRIFDRGNNIWKNPSIVEVNKFYNKMQGQPEKLTLVGNNGIAIERGSQGMVIVNVSGNSNLNISTSLRDGSYTDKNGNGTFTVSGGKITGNLSHESIVVLY